MERVRWKKSMTSMVENTHDSSIPNFFAYCFLLGLTDNQVGMIMDTPGTTIFRWRTRGEVPKYYRIKAQKSSIYSLP